MTARIVFRIRKDGRGMGGFLSPPGHPDLYYVVEGYYPRGNATPNPARRSESDSSQSLSSAIKNEYGDIPESVQRSAQRIMDAAKLVCSELWIRNAYGYFRNSYAPESGSRNVSHAVSTGPAERHLGYLTVKEFFADHAPRVDLIANPGKGYGSYPCVKCGERVQYDAYTDALCVFDTRNPECAKGGTHDIGE